MKNLKTFYENTILENIDFEGYGTEQPIDDFDKIQLVYKTFQSEYVHQNNQHQNEVFLFSEWLKGLPSILTVPFYNYEILENAKKAGFLTIQRSVNGGGFETVPSEGRNLERQENSFLENYWIKLAKAFFTLKDNL